MSGAALLTGFDLCRAALAVEGITAPEQSVLTTLAIMANGDAQCWPGIAALVAKTKLSERTVQRAVQGLKEAQHIVWVDKPGCGRTYTVHPRHSGTPTPVAETPRQADTPATVAATPVTVAPKLPRTPIPQKAKPSSVSRETKSKLGFHRLPEDWQPEPLPDVTLAKVSKWPPGKLENETATFRGWAANADDKDGKGRKLNWQIAYINWLNKADSDWTSRNGTGQRSQSAGQSITGHGRTADAFARFAARG